jgi:hypothetical protein
VHQIAWNLAASHTISENQMGEHLEKAFNEELDTSYDRLYDLLSLAYDANSIHHIRDNLESGTSEGIGFAIELLDIFVAEEVKPVLFPVLEDTSIVEKIRQLQAEFPIVIMEPAELLLAVINRDPNLTGPVTKAASIHALGGLEEVQLSDDLLAQVFNPDELLSEMAALQVSRMDRSRYEKVLSRLPADSRSRLTKQVRDAEEGWGNLIWDRMIDISRNKYLGKLPSTVLYRIAREMELVHLMPEQSMDLIQEDGGAKVGLVRTGELKLRVDDRETVTLAPNDLSGILPFTVHEKNTIKIHTAAEASLLLCSQELIDEMMFDHEDLALAIYDWVREKKGGWDGEQKEMVS